MSKTFHIPLHHKHEHINKQWMKFKVQPKQLRQLSILNTTYAKKDGHHFHFKTQIA